MTSNRHLYNAYVAKIMYGNNMCVCEKIKAFC